MTKLQQLAINNEIQDVVNDLQHCVSTFGSVKIGNLRFCNARVYQTYGYTYLISYDTIVAAIGNANHICYDFLRLVYGYTSTSAQHISKFAKDYGAKYIARYRPIY